MGRKGKGNRNNHHQPAPQQQQQPEPEVEQQAVEPEAAPAPEPVQSPVKEAESPARAASAEPPSESPMIPEHAADSPNAPVAAEESATPDAVEAESQQPAAEEPAAAEPPVQEALEEQQEQQQEQHHEEARGRAKKPPFPGHFAEHNASTESFGGASAGSASAPITASILASDPDPVPNSHLDSSFGELITIVAIGRAIAIALSVWAFIVALEALAIVQRRLPFVVRWASAVLRFADARGRSLLRMDAHASYVDAALALPLAQRTLDLGRSLDSRFTGGFVERELRRIADDAVDEFRKSYDKELPALV